MMLDTDDFVVSPVKTAGLAHVPNLTHESAKATEELLKDNNNRYHIFFTLEDHMGVGLAPPRLGYDQGSVLLTSKSRNKPGLSPQPHCPPRAHVVGLWRNARAAPEAL